MGRPKKEAKPAVVGSDPYTASQEDNQSDEEFMNGLQNKLEIESPHTPAPARRAPPGVGVKVAIFACEAGHKTKGPQNVLEQPCWMASCGKKAKRAKVFDYEWDGKPR